ncbi:MAG: bifunctional metallophosphatase/5'-nucleotidase, partial [Candidatus Obscuribacterales bacterium]|nr:bifunctional metallophosphatase/5'-nucleotidase [Candidatus Obscuribacterales bacterium]
MFRTSPKLASLSLIIALSLPAFYARPAFSDDTASQEKFTITILHSNDTHSHEDSFVEHGKNLGGMPRIAHVIREAKKNNKHVLAVDAGDIFQGTGFFETYKGEVEIECMNKAGYDLYTIGNHDFDEGPENLGKQLKNAKFDVISCNLDVSSDPNLSVEVKPSVVKEIAGQKIGFIGIITPQLVELAPKLGAVKLISAGPNWMEPLRAEIEKLKKQGVNKIIVVSHCGVDLETLMAKSIPDIDVVVGGHSHTRLDKATVVDQADGAHTMVVQTGSYGRTLGELDLVFDKSGKLIMPETKYKLIDLTEKVSEEPDVKAYVVEKAKPFAALQSTILSEASANFDNRFKRFEFDSGIGDILTDAIAEATKDQGVTMAFQNRGGIRAGIDQGPISVQKVREILPFPNKVMVATVSGKTLMGVLEHSASAMTGGSAGGRFLDEHGVKFAYDPLKEDGHQVIYAYAQDKDGSYKEITPDQNYRIAVNDFTFNGGESYDFKEAKDVLDTGKRVSAVFEDYLSKHKIVTPQVPSRFLRVSHSIAKRNASDKGDTI